MDQSAVELLSHARQAAIDGNAKEVDRCIVTIATIHQIGTLDALDKATNKATGDTLLHLAAMHGQIGIIRQIRQTCFSRAPPWGKASARRCTYTLQPNKTNGNTALHNAVVQDDLDVVRAIYRFFNDGWLPGEDDLGESPIENATDRADEEEDYAPSLVLLAAKNAAGRDAAAQARVAGREENAKWCQEVIDRLDPRGEHQTPEELERLKQFVNILFAL